MTRALAMISGGLDSTLAAKLVKDQGIEVIGVCFKSYFFGEESAKKMCEQIGVELVVVDFSREHFEMRTHKRIIDIYEPTAQTTDELSRMDLPAGVDIEVKL